MRKGICSSHSFRAFTRAMLFPAIAACSAVAPAGFDSRSGSLGVFDVSCDVGAVTHRGSAKFTSGTSEYELIGSGANMWGQVDAFHYLWKEVSGDLSLTARIRWIGEGKNEHRKAGWMIRQSLDPDSPYADAVVHGDGLTSLQFRKTKSGPTEEIKSPLAAPAFIRLERHGNVFSLYVSKDGEVYHPVGSVSVALQDPVHAGLAICSHDDSTTETAVFSEVDMEYFGSHENKGRIVESTLETISIATGLRQVVYRSRTHFEAPNWSNDGKYLLFNSAGRLLTIPVSGGTPVPLNTGFANRCNNDHGFSPDGKMLAISHHHEGKSLIYVLPGGGGLPRQITEMGPSYWHGWSPDGRTLAYCAERNGNYDVYAIPVEGGQETRLTDAEGLDDGPDYSADGRYIYFNSERTGVMRIWRMDSDGANQVQATNDDQYADWFPHPSPDGKWIVFLSYDKDVKGHPANKNVVLRIMPAAGGKPTVLTHLFGGQGTINVPSWSPDSKQVAFVSYNLIVGNTEN